jgi:hypothetical protein
MYMTGQESEASGMRLALEDRLPLSWTSLAAHPDPLELGRLEIANHEALYLALYLDEFATDDPAGELGPANAHELGRMEFKIDLLLDLVGQLVIRHVPLPAPVHIRLTPAEIHWTGDSAPEAGSLVRIEVYLNPKYPRPLVLIGRVESVSGLAPGLTIAVRVDPLSETFQDSLEKIIFRHHRRMIAHSRRSAGRREP